MPSWAPGWRPHPWQEVPRKIPPSAQALSDGGRGREELCRIQMFIIQTSWIINAKIYENAEVALFMIQECEV